MFVCYFVNNTSAVFNVKNTSAVCCKVSVWKSPRVIASCVETRLFCVFRQLALVYVAGKSTMFRGKPNPGKHTEVFCEMKLCALFPSKPASHSLSLLHTLSIIKVKLTWDEMSRRLRNSSQESCFHMFTISHGRLLHSHPSKSCSKK